MIPFYIFISTAAILYVSGRLLKNKFKFLHNSLSWAFTVMFIFTGITHFTNLKYDFLVMIPLEQLKHLSVVYISGAIELLSAVLLIFKSSRKYTAMFLILFLIAVLPANIYASVNNISFSGSQPTNLFLRIGIQLVFIFCLFYIIKKQKDY